MTQYNSSDSPKFIMDESDKLNFQGSGYRFLYKREIETNEFVKLYELGIKSSFERDNGKTVFALAMHQLLKKCLRPPVVRPYRPAPHHPFQPDTLLLLLLSGQCLLSIEGIMFAWSACYAKYEDKLKKIKLVPEIQRVISSIPASAVIHVCKSHRHAYEMIMG